MSPLTNLGRRGALGLTGAALLAGRARAADPAEVKIAMVVPLSGAWSKSGIGEQQGARMAIDEINASGGIKALGGAKMKLIEIDAGDSAAKAKEAAQKLLADHPDLSGGFGCWLSTFTLAVTEVTEPAELPWMTLSYSDVITGRGMKYVFQSSPTADAQAEQLVPIIADLATKARGRKPRRMALIGDNTAASVSFYKPIRGHIVKDLDLTMTVDEIFTPPLTDASKIVQQLRENVPDFAVLQSTSVPDDRKLLDSFFDFGLTSKKMPLVGSGGHWCSTDLIKLVGADGVENLIVGLANWPGKKAADVTKRFIERTKEPWFGHDPLFAYAHVKILAAAMEMAGSADRRKIGIALHSMDLKDGPADLFPDGRVSYDEKGRRRGAGLCVVQYQNGVPLAVFPETIAVTEATWPRPR